MKKIIITGVTGQDGSHMADYLLKNTQNTIIAGVRRLSVKNHTNIAHLINHPRFEIIDLDITDAQNVSGVIAKHQPDYFINFAANSFVGNSWSMPANHMQTNTMAVLYQLDSILKDCPHCRYYNAGSSEEFGDVDYSPQDENHPLKPRSPYGASKASARHLVKVYRESFNIFAVQGWLFNHEGSRRGEEFVTRKISKTIASIIHSINNNQTFQPLSLGNLDAKRDWSDAEDFVEGVWLMLQQEKPKDYVLSSGKCFSIKDFVNECLKLAGLEGYWHGKGVDEKFILDNYLIAEHSLKSHVIVDIKKEFYRPAEVNLLLGDPSLAEKELGWERKTNFKKLVQKMYNHDYNLLCNK
jgi:GDPmannose 4,6-dehydratase